MMNAMRRRQAVRVSRGNGIEVEAVNRRRATLANSHSCCEAILERKDAILDAAHRDLGKHPTETNLTEVLPLVGEVKHAIAKLKRWMKPQRIGPTAATLGTTSRVVYQPKGRCLIISPWNYPLSLALGPLVSAVAAGNTAILKPSEFTPNTNRVVKDIIGAVFPRGRSCCRGRRGADRHRPALTCPSTTSSSPDLRPSERK